VWNHEPADQVQSEGGEQPTQLSKSMSTHKLQVRGLKKNIQHVKTPAECMSSSGNQGCILKCIKLPDNILVRTSKRPSPIRSPESSTVEWTSSCDQVKRAKCLSSDCTGHLVELHVREVKLIILISADRWRETHCCCSPDRAAQFAPLSD
jgi:hypothetical protein